MSLTDEEVLGLKINQQVAMGKRIFKVVRFENISGFKEPVLVDEKGERLSSVLFVAHILNHYAPPSPKVDEPKKEADDMAPTSTTNEPTNDEAEDNFKLV